MVRLPKHFSERPSVTTPLKPSQTWPVGLALTLGLMVTSCVTAPEKAAVDSAPSTPAPEKVVEQPLKEPTPPVTQKTPPKESPIAAQPDLAPTKQPEAGSELVTVSVYTIDDQCNDFVEQSIEVPRDKAVFEAVGKAMSAVDYNAFKLASYEVSINGSTATVDMELAPGSQRQFVSLSSCEQRALFGSIEETLLNNTDWQVNAVKFTSNGKEIVL